MHDFTETELKKEAGKLLNQRRKELGLSQEKLAENLGIEVKTLSKIENGYTLFSAKTLCALCKFFNLPPKSFFDFNNSETVNERKINEILYKIKESGEENLDTYYALVNMIFNIISKNK